MTDEELEKLKEEVLKEKKEGLEQEIKKLISVRSELKEDIRCQLQSIEEFSNDLKDRIKTLSKKYY